MRKIIKIKDLTWGELKRVIEKNGVREDMKIHLIDIDADGNGKEIFIDTEENNVFITNFSNI